MIRAKMAHNVTGVAEPAKRVAERPASKARFIPPPTRAAAGGISARPSTAGGLSPPRSAATKRLRRVEAVEKVSISQINHIVTTLFK